MAQPNLPTATVNQSDKFNFFPYGMAILDFGLAVQSANNGFGLMTRGLVWQGYDIWWDSTAVSGISTAWTQSFSGSSLVTTWTKSQFGSFGEFPPSGV